MEEECCDSISAVFDGGPATDLAQCWLECTTPECEDECYATFPDGIDGFGAYDACTTVNCFSQEFCDVSPCTRCSATRCACEYAACLTDVDCHLIRQCIAGCESSDCAEACMGEHPRGHDKAELLMTCLAQNCIDDC